MKGERCSKHIPSSIVLSTDGGYDIEDFKTVNPRFGSNQDLEDLFVKAKDLGIKIILDFVGFWIF
jgi:glycosidase